MRVGNIWDLIGEREIREFFSFSGDIDHLEIQRNDVGLLMMTFVTFKDPKALNIILLLSGVMIVYQIVGITRAEDYVARIEEEAIAESSSNVSPVGNFGSIIEGKDGFGSGQIYANKAHDVVIGILARSSSIGEVINKAKAFDEKHRLIANASAKVISFDRQVNILEKITVGVLVVNEKV